jgi:hypothetical protein
MGIPRRQAGGRRDAWQIMAVWTSSAPVAKTMRQNDRRTATFHTIASAGGLCSQA